MQSSALSRLLRNAHSTDLVRLDDLDSLLRRIYIASWESRSARHPSHIEVPWPVALVLGGLSRKFIASRRSFDQAAVISAVSDACCKLKWRWHFRHEGTSPSSAFLPKLRRTPPYRSRPDAEIIGACASLSQHMRSCMASARRLCSRLSSPNPSWLRWALAWLRASPWRVWPSDKDGGYCLVLRVECDDWISHKVDRPTYFCSPPSSLSVFSFAKDLASVGQALEQSFGIDGLARRLVAATRSYSNSEFWSPLNYLVKTHKAAGAVALRVIHDCGSGVLRPLGEILHRLLLPSIRSLPHLCFSSEDVLVALRSVRLSAVSRLATLDVKEFFMSPQHATLIDNCFKHHDQPQQSAGRAALRLFLSHQGVQDSESGRCYLVTVGSGMGCAPSSDACDATFFELAESPWACSRLVQQRHSVRVWLRYRDDVFVVYDCPRLFRAFLVGIRQRLHRVWEIELSAVSRVSVNFLDLTLYRDGFSDCIKFRPYVKPTARGVPLNQHSHHPPTCLQWPHAHLHRLALHSCNLESFEWAKLCFICRLVSGLAWPRSIAQVMLSHPYSFSAISSLSRNSVRLPPHGSDNVVVITLILPYHPALASTISKLGLEELSASLAPQLACVFNGRRVAFRIAWRRGGRHLYTLLRRL